MANETVQGWGEWLREQEQIVMEWFRSTLVRAGQKFQLAFYTDRALNEKERTELFSTAFPGVIITDYQARRAPGNASGETGQIGDYEIKIAGVTSIGGTLFKVLAGVLAYIGLQEVGSALVDADVEGVEGPQNASGSFAAVVQVVRWLPLILLLFLAIMLIKAVKS